MQLDERDADGQQGVTQSHARMRECSRIQQNEVDVAACRMDPLEQFVLGVALKSRELVSELAGEMGQQSFDVRQRRRAVDLGLTCAEQAEIGSVEQK